MLSVFAEANVPCLDPESIGALPAVLAAMPVDDSDTS